MRFIEDLPIVQDKLPICPDGTDIAISYYLFNKGTTPENPTGEGFPVLNYAYEAAYAYQQLLRHTNIQECGRVRFFIDQRCEDQMRPYFELIGLETLIEIINVPIGVRLSGYLPQLSHEAVSPCKYRFHSDVDLWWIDPNESGELFDFKAFCAFLDESDDDSFYGQPIEKQDWIYQINYSQHALAEDVQEKARQTLLEIFGPRIPDAFTEIAYTHNDILRERNKLLSLRCFAGWFVGVRENSTPLWYINKLYNTYEDYLSDDEGLFSLLFYLYPDLKQYKVLQGVGELKAHEIPQQSLLNYKEREGVATINVGAQEFYMEEHKAERHEFAQYFGGGTETESVAQQQTPVIELPPAPNGLNTFGRHIIGTYALDSGGKVFPLLSHSENNHSVLFGFPAALEPIKTPLKNANKKDAEIVLFYCLFHHPQFVTHDIHVYAKSMVYAYKMLITHTNICDVGRVVFFIDKRCMNIVYPYCQEASIQNLIVPIECSHQIQYASYIPCFWHNEIKNAKYRVYMDVDMWWINLHEKPPFDYQQVIETLENQNADIFGYPVPKTPDSLNADLYKRCIWEGDTHIDKTKTWIEQNFKTGIPQDIRSISGCHNAIRNSKTLEKLSAFYEETGEFIRDDEAFWAVFLTQNPQLQIYPLHEIISGVGFSEEEVKHHNQPELAHVGTYMFEHFYNKPYAEAFYKHCRTEET